LTTGPPLPPVELATRVGTVEGADPLAFYLSEGAAVRGRIERLLPAGWTFDGKRVLDFGCGSARVLRHFLDEAERGEFWGCDVDGPSIDWVNAELSPPLRCFRNDPAPPLPFADGHLDLIWATSVFTHIELWSDWLVELHRVLAQDGILIASWLGGEMWEALIGEPYREDEVGMTVQRHWEESPWVFHSEWWLRAHWGRAFEVTEVVRPQDAQVTHSYIAMRKRPVEIDRHELERCDARDPRELAALRTNVRLLRGEIDALIAERSSGGRARLRALRRRLRAAAQAARTGRS
jgi:SAM-dependent methyltransferase